MSANVYQDRGGGIVGEGEGEGGIVGEGGRERGRERES